MNPYDFVRIAWSQGVKRRPATRPHRFQGTSGRIQGTITTLTPLFIPSYRQQTTHITNRKGEAIIPGTSLKGLIRSLVETIGPGCWWLFKSGPGGRLPHPFRQCQNHEELCVACRLFGLIKGKTLLLGNVGFEDAICVEHTPDSPMYTPSLMNPRPRHSWYRDDQGHVVGRKFYFHNTQTIQDRRQTNYNRHIRPVAPENTFTFWAQFTNLADDELRLLLYALLLEPTMRHKIGYAKPAGLGSVKIELTRLELIDYAQRYTTSDQGNSTYTGAELQEFMAQQIFPYTENQTSVTLTDLRRIWAWPPPDDVVFGYPTRRWFDENSDKPINATRHAPVQ